MNSNIPLDTQKKLQSLRLDVDEDIVDDLERNLDKHFAKAKEYRDVVHHIARPLKFLQDEAERQKIDFNLLEAQRSANSAEYLRSVALNTVQSDVREMLHEKEVEKRLPY